MRKTLAAVLTALALVTVTPAVAEAKGGGGGGSSSSAWPTATAPLPAGTILSQSSSKAVVLSPVSVSLTMRSLDAAYVNAGWTVGVSSGIPRWYKRGSMQVNVFYAALDGGQSQITLFMA